MDTYGWFLNYCLSINLPDGWVREIDPNHKIIYHSIIEQITTKKHPYRHQFRKAFAQLIIIERLKNRIKTKINNEGKEDMVNQLMEKPSGVLETLEGNTKKEINLLSKLQVKRISLLS